VFIVKRGFTGMLFLVIYTEFVSYGGGSVNKYADKSVEQVNST